MNARQNFFAGIAVLGLLCIADYYRVQVVRAERQIHILKARMGLEVPVVDAPKGVITNSDATRVNARLEEIDRRVGSSQCAEGIAGEMNQHSPKGSLFIYSPHLLLHEPMIGETGWGDQINYDFQVIDLVLDSCLR